MARIDPVTHTLRTGEEIVLRTPRIRDAADMVKYFKGIVEDGSGMVELPEETTLTVPLQVKSVVEYTAHPTAIMITAFAGDEMVGLLDFRPAVRVRLRHAGEFGISVAPRLRGKGLGRILLRRFLDWARTTDLEKVNLYTRSDNLGAIELYKSLGFVEQGRFPREIKLGGEEYVDGVSMYLFL